VDNLIKTNLLAQDGKDEGADAQVVKVMDIINIFKSQV
jgi:hypothetical protein